MPDISLDPQFVALVLIDLQQGIVSRPLQPHAAADVVSRGVALAAAFRKVGAPVVLVHVDMGVRAVAAPKGAVDEAMPRPAAPPANWSDLVPELGPTSTDLIILKRQWSAFYGTELDLQLRRRGINTIVLGGVATNFGVESTARDAWEHNYHVVLVEDAMTSLSAEAHTFAVKTIFPRLGRVRSTADVLAALSR